MFILLFLQVNLAVITIRSKYGKDLKYGFLLPFFPILPMIAIGMQFLLLLSLFNVSIIAWIYAAIWIGGGFSDLLSLRATTTRTGAPDARGAADRVDDADAGCALSRSGAGGQSRFAFYLVAAGGSCRQDA